MSLQREWRAVFLMRAAGLSPPLRLARRDRPVRQRGWAPAVSGGCVANVGNERGGCVDVRCWLPERWLCGNVCEGTVHRAELYRCCCEDGLSGAGLEI